MGMINFMWAIYFAIATRSLDSCATLLSQLKVSSVLSPKYQREGTQHLPKWCWWYKTQMTRSQLNFSYFSTILGQHTLTEFETIISRANSLSPDLPHWQYTVLSRLSTSTAAAGDAYYGGITLDLACAARYACLVSFGCMFSCFACHL